MTFSWPRADLENVAVDGVEFGLRDGDLVVGHVVHDIRASEEGVTQDQRTGGFGGVLDAQATERRAVNRGHFVSVLIDGDGENQFGHWDADLGGREGKVERGLLLPEAAVDQSNFFVVCEDLERIEYLAHNLLRESHEVGRGVEQHRQRESGLA